MSEVDITDDDVFYMIGGYDTAVGRRFLNLDDGIKDVIVASVWEIYQHALTFGQAHFPPGAVSWNVADALLKMIGTILEVNPYWIWACVYVRAYQDSPSC